MHLKMIKPDKYVYMVTDPNYKIVEIDYSSGNPMQSAAKNPIFISFYCRKFEGPDTYFRKLQKANHSQKQDYFEEDFSN